MGGKGLFNKHIAVLHYFPYSLVMLIDLVALASTNK